MKIILKKAVAVWLCLLMLAGIAAASAVSGAAQETTGVIAVSAEALAEEGFSAAVQAALDLARETASEEAPVTVTAPAGSYDLAFGLHIFDNTILDLRGVTVTRTALGNMLRVGSEDTVDTGAAGYQYRNITLRGGVFDGGAGYNTMIKVAHTGNFTMDGVTLCNEHNGHMMEVAGVDGFTVRGCVFRDQLLDVGGVGYEAIQLDILHPDHMVNCRAEDLNCKSILIEDCVFENVPRGVGTHTGVLNNPFDGVTIRNNLFREIGSAAIQGTNWKNVRITGNRIEGAARGVSLYAVMSGVYCADCLAALGSTEVHVPCAYVSPRTTHVEIAYNTLRDIGTVDDPYASYVSQGIAVIGDVITEPEDREGAIPVGIYDYADVSVHDNEIAVHGHGVRLEQVRDADVSGNLIRCAANTVHPANYYGVVALHHAQIGALTRNVITDAAVNGIQLVDSSVDTLSRNRVERTGKYGVAAYGATLRDITENDVSGAANQGIVLLDASTVQRVTCNRVSDCGKQGVYFTKDCAAGTVAANTTVRVGGSIAYTRSAKKVTVGANHTATAPLTSFVLDGAGVRLGVGTAYLLVPDVRPVNAMARFRFASEDKSVAQVDAYGRITAVGVGQTDIVITSDNGKAARFRVTVDDGEEAALIPADRVTAPKLTTLECIDGGIRLSWEAVDGAHGYRLYYRYGNGGWKRMKDVDGLSCTDRGVSVGRTETYTIRALGANGEPNSGYDPAGWSITYQLGTPEITSLQNTNEGIVLRWGTVKGVARYRVYFKNGSGGWTALGTTAGTSFTDRKVKSGRTETYTVRGLDKNDQFITMYNHVGWQQTYVAAPVISETQSAADGILLSWQAVAGAAGYRVYYKNTKGGWSELGDSKTANFTDTDVRSGRTYTYTVRCLDANGNPCSGYSVAGWKATFVAVPDFQLQRAAAGVRISWQPVAGAYGCKVFYKNGKGGWTALGTTTGSYYYDTAVRRGGSYTYTVRCVDRSGHYISDYLRSGRSITY